MPITELLEENARKYGNDVALVEVNPQVQETRRVLWKDYDLIQPTSSFWYRREITWHVFDEKANRFAQLLMSRGVKKGDKVAILLMNCLEWLPIYFGTLKTGALAVPMNFRYSAEEIEYCLDLAEADVLVFGPEFIGRIETIAESISKKRILFYVGGDCPSFAEDYDKLTSNCASISPGVPLTDEDDAAIYFSSGTTGFPKAILHNHESLMHACKVEQNHHHQTKDDVFLCIPPLYHTGAKMHWFGSLLTGGRAVLLKGVNPETILETISREKCTIVWLLVPWALDILEALDNGSVRLENYELSQWRLMHIGAQPVPQSLIKRFSFCHFTFGNVGKLPNHCMEYNAVGTMQSILVPGTIIANRFNVKIYGTRLLKQLSFCCFQRCFSGFNMTALRFPCGSFLVPAQNHFSMALGKDDHILVFFQSIYLVGLTTHNQL